MGTLHLLRLLPHPLQRLLVAHHLLHARLQFFLQAVDLALRFCQLIDFGEVVILFHEIFGEFLSEGLDVIFGLVLAVVDFLDFVLQFFDQSVDVSLGVGLAGA